MMCLNPKFCWALDHAWTWYLAEIGKFCHLLKLTLIEWSLSKLSENQPWNSSLATERVPEPLITHAGDSANCVCINYYVSSNRIVLL